jgi:hypothetical protein
MAAALFLAGMTTAAVLSFTRGTAHAFRSRPSQTIEYRLLATSKTSTMQKELNQAGDAGFRFQHVMGGETTFGKEEVVAVAARTGASDRYEYKLLATLKTSTMQKELNQAGDAGFRYRGQTVFKTRFGGQEVVVILERNKTAHPRRYQYRLLATSKTSTMQKELSEAGEAGFEVVGLTVSKTAFGGKELVAITQRGE